MQALGGKEFLAMSPGLVNLEVLNHKQDAGVLHVIFHQAVLYADTSLFLSSPTLEPSIRKGSHLLSSYLITRFVNTIQGARCVQEKLFGGCNVSLC
jgi:hypothetical protein